MNRAFNYGPVWRIAEYRVKPDRGADFMKFLREHRLQIFAEQKRQGLIVDYKLYFNPTNSEPQEPQHIEAVLYRNFAEALDADDDRTKKFNDIGLKHYGTDENRRKVQEQLPNMRELLRSYTLREMTISPAKPATASSQ